jgi:hypothetical protein
MKITNLYQHITWALIVFNLFTSTVNAIDWTYTHSTHSFINMFFLMFVVIALVYVLPISKSNDIKRDG